MMLNFKSTAYSRLHVMHHKLHSQKLQSEAILIKNCYTSDGWTMVSKARCGGLVAYENLQIMNHIC